MKIKIIVLLCLYSKLVAQKQVYILPELIQLAQQNSNTTKIARVNNTIVQMQYNSFLLQLKPNVSFTGNVPVYDKDNFSVRQPDGSIKFLNRQQINSNVGIGFVQPIAATGGAVSINASLNRFDNLIGNTKTFSGTPIFVQLQQPLFAYNELKWRKRIEPLKLECH